MDALQALYEKNKEHIVAIGECGIDTHYPDGAENIELQKELFHRQCQLAKDLGLPVVIHSRDDFDSTREVVKNFVDQKIYFHCYGYGKDEISILQEACHQLRVGFCGNVTYPKAQPLRDALLACDLENIVFETDAPYLAPQVLRGKTNEPANVRYIYEYVAELLQMNLPTLAEKIEKNVKRLYSL